MHETLASNSHTTQEKGIVRVFKIDTTLVGGH